MYRDGKDNVGSGASSNNPLDSQCSEDHILKIAASRLAYDWKTVGRRLTDYRTIDDIEREEDTEQRKRDKMFQKWLSKAGSGATYRALIAALEDLQYYNVAEEVKSLVTNLAKAEQSEPTAVQSEPTAEQPTSTSLHAGESFVCGCGKCSVMDYFTKGCETPKYAADKFPYLNNTKLSSTELNKLKNRLRNEAQKITDEFEALVWSAKKLLSKKKSLLDVKIFCKGLQITPRFHEKTPLFETQTTKIDDATNSDIILHILQDYWSWFSFKILEKLIQFMEDEELVKQLNTYDDHLKIFMKRGIIECPVPLKHQDVKPNFTCLIFKLSDAIKLNKLTLDELKYTLSNVSETLEILDVLDVMTIVEGCIEIVCTIPETVYKYVWNLPKHQLHKLSAFNIQKISSIKGDYEISDQICQSEQDTDVALKQIGKRTDRKEASQNVEQFVDLEIVLMCTSKTCTEKRMVGTFSISQTILHVKQFVQKQFSIPVYVQDFTYKSQSYVDTTSLQSISLQSGDTVNIFYPSDPDCAAIDKAIIWLRQAVECILNVTPSVRHSVSREVSDLMRCTELKDLFIHSFQRSDEATKAANSIYFMQTNGICLLISLLKYVQRVPWPDQLDYMRWVELMCLIGIDRICRTRELGAEILKYGGLECCIKPLTYMVVKRDRYPSDADFPMLLESVMIASIVALASLSEYAESCRMKLAPNQFLLTQILNISTVRHTEYYRSIFHEKTAASYAAMLFYSIAFTVETHKFLTNSEFITGIIYICQMYHPWSIEKSSNLTVLTWYYTCMCLAQVVLISWRKIGKFELKMISNLMEHFMETFSLEDIRNLDVKYCTTYSTFLPFIRLFYIPDSDKYTGCDAWMSKLQITCLSVVIHMLQATLQIPKHCRVVSKEGLLDYITCIQFFVPDCLKAKAQSLVTIVASSQNGVLQPPRLVSLSKAKLARMHSGLEMTLATN